MISFDLMLHKEIVRLLRDEGLLVVDNQLKYKTPVVVIGESKEYLDNTKTFGRNSIVFTLKMWGSENGSSLEIKELKERVIKALTNNDYFDPESIYRLEGAIIDSINIEEVYLFKEFDSENKTKHYFQSSINITYKIRGI